MKTSELEKLLSEGGCYFLKHGANTIPGSVLRLERKSEFTVTSRRRCQKEPPSASSGMRD